MNKFEQLIEYVINDEEAKARELFHQIVVEKSRTIYEDLMNQDEDLEESVEEEDLEEEDLEEGMDGVPTTGDASDDLIDDIEAEEEGMAMEDDAEFDDEAEEAGNDLTHDIEGEGDLEDRVVDLEDKLDELMAEFEAMMGDEAGEDHGDDVGDEAGGDAIEVDDTEAEFPMGDEEMMAENVTLKAAPKPVTSEEGGVNKKSTVAANSGARGAVAKPVHTGANEGGHHDSGAYKNATKDLIGKVGNTPAQGTQKPSAAPKPVTTQQAAGVNDRSPVPRG
jgi:hypothetical protein